MAVIVTHRSHAFGSQFSGRIASNVSQIVSDVARWNDARVTRKTLAKLTDRQLEDIGLCRGDLEQVQ